jgi:hypothetical protein
VILLPGFKTGRGLNDREHPMKRHRRVKAEKLAVSWQLATFNDRKPALLPCVCTLTRFAPSNGLDDDNLAGSLKGVRDAVAAWLGVDDRDRKRVRYQYEQQRAPWGVGIAFTEVQP